MFIFFTILVTGCKIISNVMEATLFFFVSASRENGFCAGKILWKKYQPARLEICGRRKKTLFNKVVYLHCTLHILDCFIPRCKQINLDGDLHSELLRHDPGV
jgi:hypothetical protein